MHRFYYTLVLVYSTLPRPQRSVDEICRCADEYGMEETSEFGGQKAYSMLSPSIRKRRSGFEGYTSTVSDVLQLNSLYGCTRQHVATLL